MSNIAMENGHLVIVDLLIKLQIYPLPSGHLLQFAIENGP